MADKGKPEKGKPDFAPTIDEDLTRNRHSNNDKTELEDVDKTHDAYLDDLLPRGSEGKTAVGVSVNRHLTAGVDRRIVDLEQESLPAEALGDVPVSGRVERGSVGEGEVGGFTAEPHGAGSPAERSGKAN